MRWIAVHHLGAVEENRPSYVYYARELFVMPTIPDEMFGMAVLEAEAYGKPIIASRLGGLLEAISDKSGLFVPSGDRRSLGEALAEVVADSKRRAEMGAASGREHASRFMWDRIAARVETICEAIT